MRGAVGAGLCSGTLGCPDSDLQHSGRAPRWLGSVGKTKLAGAGGRRRGWGCRELGHFSALLFKVLFKPFSFFFFFSFFQKLLRSSKMSRRWLRKGGSDPCSRAAQHPELSSPGPAAAAGLRGTEGEGRGPVSPRQFFKLSGCLLFPAGARPACGSLPGGSHQPGDVNPSRLRCLSHLHAPVTASGEASSAAPLSHQPSFLSPRERVEKPLGDGANSPPLPHLPKKKKKNHCCIQRWPPPHCGPGALPLASASLYGEQGK